MRTEPPRQLPIFRSRLQADLLRTLFVSERDDWTPTALARTLGVSISGVVREIDRLVEADLVRVKRVGASKLVEPEKGSPLYEPLRQLIERSIGLEAELSRRLGDLEAVEAAAIFGSWASGQTSPGSDVDVFVLGAPDFAELVEATHDLQESAGREINFVTLSRQELDDSVMRRDPFVVRALRGPRVPLVGHLPHLDDEVQHANG